VSDVALVLHGHFYQPPRENPWTEEVPVERSAAPFHDWNERITAECYRPNGWARILDDQGRTVAITNNYERLSFNVGPTLMSWMEEHHPETYERILGADAAAGRAIAQAYSHPILPLCNERDLRTQVRWGMADFEHRFGRRADGMWLPETGVNDVVLRVLAEEGVGFTILAPSQADVADGELDASIAHRWVHPERPDLGVDLVFYDGGLSHDLAFGGVASQTLVARAITAAPEGGLVCAATDGETFGHHHKFADRGVAYALAIESERRDVETPRLADWLAANRPADETGVRESAWSCVHGVARWKEDCGCHTGGEPGWNQAWRAPLRAALDVLRDAGIEIFERRGSQVLRDPWAARDAYIGVILGSVSVEDFAREHITGDAVDALTLLEAQRHALLMYTSCGWFFNDLAGLETIQILRYAARAADLLAELGEKPPLDRFLEVLGEARSNRSEEGDGRQIWERHVEPSRVDAHRVVAHLALVQLLRDGDPATELAGHQVVERTGEHLDRGGLSACAGTLELAHRRTGRRTRHAYAALHLGGFEVFGAARELEEGDDASDAVAALSDAFTSGERVTALLRLVVEGFGPQEFGLDSALPDAADQLVQHAADALAARFAAAYDQLREDHADTFSALITAGYTLPADLRAPVEVALTRRLETDLAEAASSEDDSAYRAALATARVAERQGLEIASPRARSVMGLAVDRAVEAAVASAGAEAVGDAMALLSLARELHVVPDLDHAEELVYDALTSAALTPERRRQLEPLGAALGLAVGRLGPAT
jgi:hypothetical protein